MHSRAAECLVLSGDLRSNDADLTTVNGCECLLITAIGD